MTGLVVLIVRLAVLAALCAFLGIAFWIIWQDLKQVGAASAARVPRLRLEIRTRQGQPEVRTFVQPEVIVGRDPPADLPLSDKAVSTRHARFSFHHGQWWIDDLGSRNGTRLNGDRLQTSAVLTTGDEVRCGSTRVLITLPSEVFESRQRGGQHG